MKPTSKEVINELSKILDATPKKINGFITPKQKANELVIKYLVCTPIVFITEDAKKCALIAVDEMLSNDGWSSSHEEWNTFKNYFEEVKQEIKQI